MQCGDIENGVKHLKRQQQKFETHFEVAQYYVHQRWVSFTVHWSVSSISEAGF